MLCVFLTRQTTSSYKLEPKKDVWISKGNPWRHKNHKNQNHFFFALQQHILSSWYYDHIVIKINAQLNQEEFLTQTRSPLTSDLIFISLSSSVLYNSSSSSGASTIFCGITLSRVQLPRGDDYCDTIKMTRIFPEILNNQSLQIFTWKEKKQLWQSGVPCLLHKTSVKIKHRFLLSSWLLSSSENKEATVDFFLNVKHEAHENTDVTSTAYIFMRICRHIIRILSSEWLWFRIFFQSSKNSLPLALWNEIWNW